MCVYFVSVSAEYTTYGVCIERMSKVYTFGSSEIGKVLNEVKMDAMMNSLCVY